MNFDTAKYTCLNKVSKLQISSSLEVDNRSLSDPEYETISILRNTMLKSCLSQYSKNEVDDLKREVEEKVNKRDYSLYSINCERIINTIDSFNENNKSIKLKIKV